MSLIQRREFLKVSACGVAALGLARSAFADEPYGPFKMGIQSYTLRSTKAASDPKSGVADKLEVVLAKIKELGLKYVEFYPAHLPVTTDEKVIAEYKKKLEDHGIKAMAYGVTSLGDPNTARKTFEFAKAIGLYTITSDNSVRKAVIVDKLCEEFPDIHVGIHNHGPTDPFKKAEDVLEMVKDRHKNIGATADLGHYIRSKQDPLDAIEKLKDRLFGIHFKDFKFVTVKDKEGKEKEGDQETIVGEANLKVKETLAALKKANFQGCISLEYEKDGPKLMDDVKEALSRVQTAVKEI